MTTKSPSQSTVSTSTFVTSRKHVTTNSDSSSKTKSTHPFTTGTFTLPTSSLVLNTSVSAAPDKNHPTQNKDVSQGSRHPGETGGNDSFPTWAIVIVILLAIILLLVLLGLIFLVTYLMKTHHTLNQNVENVDSEDDSGPNSYPVYQMEQQTLNMSQISTTPL
ncbi:mucin-like protein 3 [Suncus etruscus]|uniref:mucin-like protein 3 n=1 Tax=Suncus etruscus TaxID=109475 RepID=UPI00211069BD|nr:mucin-like protein 3 [Suncus etruscus]